MVTITVGKDTSQKTFHMYRGLLCFHSEYFKILFEGGFREAQSDTHTMPETDVDIFELFYAWICTGTISKPDGTCEGGIDHATITRLYAFADYHMMEELKNRSAELYFIHTVEASQTGFLGTADLYNRTAAGCSLRRLHVNILLEKDTFSYFRLYVKDLPTDFIADIVETSKAKGLACGRDSLVGWRTWAMDVKPKFCKNYHQHTDTSDRRSTEPV
jgi:hypothetical protein